MLTHFLGHLVRLTNPNINLTSKIEDDYSILFLDHEITDKQYRFSACVDCIPT